MLRTCQRKTLLSGRGRGLRKKDIAQEFDRSAGANSEMSAKEVDPFVDEILSVTNKVEEGMRWAKVPKGWNDVIAGDGIGVEMYTADTTADRFRKSFMSSRKVAANFASIHSSLGVHSSAQY